MSDSSSYYAFFLCFEGGGYAYFKTYTLFETFGKHRREVRSPDSQSLDMFKKIFDSIDAKFIIITDNSTYDRWLYVTGWALVEKEFARRCMAQWLATRECVASPSGSMVDVLVASPSALSRSISKGKRKKVLESHLQKCFVCGSDKEAITMHHVRPYSLGGETTARNLRPLCEPCNQIKADKFDRTLYDGPLADLSLVGLFPKKNWYMDLAILSDNLMFTRCELL